MANTDQLNIIMQGPKAWNAWREENPHVRLDLNIEEAV